MNGRRSAKSSHHDEFDRELKKANSYVMALLPPTLTQGPIRTDWLYEPCSRLGGDAFGYGALNDDQFLIYMLDVAAMVRARRCTAWRS